MDWLLAGLIGAAMFWLGDMIGYAAGLRDMRARAILERRLDELRRVP